jgi:hypothetical protein
MYCFQLYGSGLRNIRTKGEPSAEGLQCLHMTVLQNCFMIAVGQMTAIMAKLLFFSMKLSMNFIERLENIGSSFQVMVI